MTGGLVGDVRDLASGVERMLAPVEVLDRCRAIARIDPRVERRIIGTTESGQPIEAYLFATAPGRPTVLLYGFPDPGEPIGANGIVALLEGFAAKHPLFARLPVSFAAIPCLNLDDQPDGGRVLRNVFKSRTVRQVDLCADDPRSETRALLSIADELRPVFTYALHDEYHGGEELPAYVGTTRILPRPTCDDMREVLGAFAIPLSAEEDHPLMGIGFVDDRRYGPRYERSAFPLLDRHGLVLSCELSDLPRSPPRDLVSAQLSVGLVALEGELHGATRAGK